MTDFQRWFSAVAILALSTGLASAQVGVIYGPGGGSMLACMATGAGTPELRPEGYTELLGDILIECTGGPLLQTGATIPTTNVTVYISPSVPITSRMLGPGPSGLAGSFVSEALLIVDEAGSSINTGATGGYGPQAPQSLCTSAQQQATGGNACAAQVGLDTSGQYQVAVVPNTSTPAQNVFQGEVGDFGANSVTFYNVPVLPPAYMGVSRTFRITNIRVPVPGGTLTGMVQAIVSTSGTAALPVGSTTIYAGIVGPAMRANANAAPAGGGNPFPACVSQTSPALAAKVTFTEGFATGFRTRVVPGGASNGIPDNSTGNTTWAGEAQNLAGPANQNIPGGLYGGYALNNESGFILPAAAFTDTTSNITYTAGLADFGTRLKAVFSNIPAGVSVYVSTTNAATYTIPGGTSVMPYAVLVAASQGNEANNDGATFTPLTSTTAGSDGLSAYPLAADNSGVTAAVWEVVNSNPSALDVLTFSVYLAYSNTLGTAAQPTDVALSFAPEPGGGTFAASDLQGLDSPSPRFGVINTYGGPFATITPCALSADTSTVPFQYSTGGATPSSQTVSVTISPSNLPVTVTPTVTTPSGGNWLSASLSSGTLTVSVNPSGLAGSSTAYTGNVKLSASGLSDVVVPVTLTVYPQPSLSITESHIGNFAQGEQGATYSITVSNAASAGPTSGQVTVTENPPDGEQVVSMTSTGNVWTCTTTSCKTSISLSGGGSYPPITVTVNVAMNASPTVTNTAGVSGGASSTSPSYGDSTNVLPLTCTVTGDKTPTVADVQALINEALGLYPAAFDLNTDGVVNVADVAIVVSGVLTGNCVL